jgi:FKBP-type peptidyl-prolyl cis-trans isomerase SlyD
MSDCITQNKVVDITYLIKDESGTAIEQNDVPVSYLHGVQGDMLPALEQALDGKQVGDSIEVELSPSESFGEHDPNLTFTDNIDNVPQEYRQIGAQAQFQNENGESKTFVVSKIEGGQITLDGNHPFAGKTVTFVVNVKAIYDASEQELAEGRTSQDYALDATNPPPVSDRH